MLYTSLSYFRICKSQVLLDYIYYKYTCSVFKRVMNCVCIINMVSIDTVLTFKQRRIGNLADTMI